MELVHTLASSLGDVLSWPTFGFMLLGVAIGFVFGMLPGLGGPVAIAVMLPFTFDLSTSGAFAFLLGAISVLAMTGDITCVLYGIPGDPGSAALVPDGHPLAVKGQAGRAIGAMLGSSLVGALVGAVALILLIPILRPLLLQFGSPEFFMLSLLGLIFLIAFGGGSLQRGAITAAIGLLISMVGVNHSSGIARYTFGQLALWDGIGLVPVAIGLFAIPELLSLSARGAIATSKDSVGNVVAGMRESFSRIGLTLRCSLIGTAAGLVPGLGGTVAQWLAYAHSVQSSRDTTPCGQGSIDGVIGPGAAQNSKEGSNLIAMTAFGIPTSVTMSLLLGAMTIKGLVPGIPMLTDHLAVTTSFVWLIVLSHIVAIVLTLALVRSIVKITAIRASILVPLLISIALLGALAASNEFRDVWLALIFGILGVVMVKLDLPRPPLILGLVLGTLMERNLTIAVARYGASWLGHPIVLGLLIITIVGLILGRRRNSALTRVQEVAAVAEPAHVEASVPETYERLFFCCVAVVAIAAALTALQWPLDTRLFPLVISIPLAVIAVIRVVAGQTATGARTNSLRLPRWRLSRFQFHKRAQTLASFVGLALLVWLFGFGVGCPIATLISVRFIGSESWRTSALAAIGIALLMFSASYVLPLGMYRGSVVNLASLFPLPPS